MPTEPTVMISGDVMELHHLIYAEREAHAAEVAERDKQIETLYALIAGDFNMKSICKVCADNVRMRKAIIAAIEDYESCDGEGVSKAAMSTLRAALAAPPTAAAQAVEGMRKALEGTTCKCRHCCPRRCFDCDVMIDSYCPGCGNEYKAEELLVVQCARCAALAAWKEATRG